MSAILKKTPKDATDFQREQLRFLLTSGDFASILSEINPSLAWLPILAEMKVIKGDAQLAPWVERNFSDPNAIREIAANIRFFGSDTADVLEYRLNRTKDLPPLLARCWRLILRHMRTNERERFRVDWFDTAPRIARGEYSPELLGRVVDTLTPKLQVGKRIGLYDRDQKRQPDRPTDLMSIEYEVDAGVAAEDILNAWPANSEPTRHEALVEALTRALSQTIEDAIDAGVESNRGYSITDTDVPSVAQHSQNAHHKGFLPIVRVIADVWTRLAETSPRRALAIMRNWRKSPLRILRRLALFASADACVPAATAADALLSMPDGQLFITNAAVEAYRLVDARWGAFSVRKRSAIEKKFAKSPPAAAFTKDIDKQRAVDRRRYEFLEHMVRRNFKISKSAKILLQRLRKKYPKWKPRPDEEAGFHVWMGTVQRVVGDARKLAAVPDKKLVSTALRQAKNKDFLDGDPWEALVQSDPLRALRGLDAEAKSKRWSGKAWRQFLWAAGKIDDPTLNKQVAALLLEAPKEVFVECISAIAWWLDQKWAALDVKMLWSLWDRVEKLSQREQAGRAANDAFTDALNSPSGNLASVLMKRLSSTRKSKALPASFRRRLDKLVKTDGHFGHLARIRLAAEVAFLFYRAPDWTKTNIIPLFDWASEEAADAWSARKYGNNIGSPELVGLTKKGFLSLFAKAEIPDEDLRSFSEWLTAIMVANFAERIKYPITAVEARSALRIAGARALSSVGHRLAVEMEKAKAADKIATWRKVLVPFFKLVWPLDAELQSPSNNFKLIQIVRASGDAFPEAATMLIPFLRPEEPNQHTSVFSISEAADALYEAAPEKMLDLVDAIVGDAPARSPYGLEKVLGKLRAFAPHLISTRKFQKLASVAVAA